MKISKYQQPNVITLVTIFRVLCRSGVHEFNMVKTSTIILGILQCAHDINRVESGDSVLKVLKNSNISNTNEINDTNNISTVQNIDGCRNSNNRPPCIDNNVFDTNRNADQDDTIDSNNSNNVMNIAIYNAAISACVWLNYPLTAMIILKDMHTHGAVLNPATCKIISKLVVKQRNVPVPVVTVDMNIGISTDQSLEIENIVIQDNSENKKAAIGVDAKVITPDSIFIGILKSKDLITDENVSDIERHLYLSSEIIAGIFFVEIFNMNALHMYMGMKEMYI